MRLIDHYTADLVGLDAKERARARVRWHRAVQRALILLGWTSDLPPTAHSERSVRVDVMDKSPSAERYSVVTLPVMRFFLARDPIELAEVYRATKRPRSGREAPADLRARDVIETTPEYHVARLKR